MRLYVLVALVSLLFGCQVNPVTGERNLQFYGSDWEQQVGAGLYAPMRQSQGGDYTLDRELTDYVRSVGNRLAAQARRKDELQFEFQVLNDSTPNAWALPGGKIAINRGLLTQLRSEAELAAVLSHEIVHADAAHGARSQSKGVLTQIGAAAGMVLISAKVDSSAGQRAAAIIPALGAQLISMKYSRDAERESDRYGMQYMSEAGYDPRGAVQLQETFVRMSEDRSNDLMSTLFATHPPSRERVRLNKETASRLPVGGETGEQRYQQRLRYLRRVKPAYDAYDAAMAAAVKEDYETARIELNKALDIEPREPIFHALDGDLYAQNNESSAALRSFNRAVELDRSFFYHLLRRGELRLEAGRDRDARDDLEQSIELLPTAQAHYLLGNMDLKSDNTATARQHYEQASPSDSEAGKKSQRELVLMDMEKTPGKFVATRQAADSNGRIYCLIRNQTRVDLTSIGIQATFVDDNGRTRQDHKSYTAVLGGGQQDKISTGWSTADRNELGRRVSCEVDRVRVAEEP